MENSDSDSSDEEFMLFCMMYDDEDISMNNTKRKHKCWVRDWIADREIVTQNNTIFKLQRQLSAVGENIFMTM